MRVTQITATVTTLILCIGDVSAYGSYNDLPRYDRRGIYNDPIYERSLGNDYDSELYERDIFSEGINLGRDLAERELYDREVAYYDRQARTPMGLGLVPRMTPTEAIGVAAACCGFLTTGIAIGAGAWYFTAKLAANKVSPSFRKLHRTQQLSRPEKHGRETDVARSAQGNHVFGLPKAP